MRRSSRFWATSGGLTALLALFCALPFLVAIYRIDILIFLLINVILAVSYRFLTLAGEFSLGHVVMMGVGAYGSALATRRPGSQSGWQHRWRRRSPVSSRCCWPFRFSV